MSKKLPKPKSKTISPKEELRKNVELKNYPAGWYYLCWLVYLCCCYAAFVPTGPVWGIHFIAYIPESAKIILLLTGGLLLLPGVQKTLYHRVTKLFGSPKGSQKVRILPAIIIAGICFIFFHTFTMKTDIYGDDIRMLKDYGDNSAFDWNWIGDVVSPKLVVNKEALTVAVHRIIAYVFSISIEKSYQIMSEIFGAIFILVWLLFAQKISREDDMSSKPLAIVLILLGMFSGAIQVFFGHVENYSFGILTFTFFLIGIYLYIEERIGTLAFVLLYLLAFKAHIAAILFFPAFLVAIGYHYRKSVPKIQSLFNWQVILRFVIVPSFVLGVILYVFLFHSWNEPYALSAGRQFQQTFLPLVSLPAPLNHYSIWSPYHIADFCNVLFLTSAPIVMLIAALMIFNRKEIEWSQPKVIIFGLAALFPSLFFMAMNPLLTPVRDWDVWTLLFPPLLFFASILLIQPKVRPYLHALFSQSIVFGAMFTIVFVAVNASPDELQPRLQDAGAYSYKSYYAGSSYIEGRSLELDYTAEAMPHFSETVSALAKSATIRQDVELANMMARLSLFYVSIGNDDSAIVWETAACKADTGTVRYERNLAGFYIHANRPNDASKILEELLQNNAHQDDDALSTVVSNLAKFYDRKDDLPSAIAWAKEAQICEPRYAKYAFDLSHYYFQNKQPLLALNELHTIPHDSETVNLFIASALAAANAYGPDSGLPYLYKAKAMAPNDRLVDSMILKMKR